MTFKLIETQDLPDILSVGKIYEHEATGAQVLYLENDDINKAFTIGFKTPPYNDNGIAHILEHSVLNGSKKYPSKEPFVELIKGSLNTFVNAMTFSDKTIYPVASTNDKDFTNLVSVYLDAVFQPNLYDNPQILEQEGWHYHLEEAEDDLIYKGVVYNEMKGATASPERQLYTQIQKHLYHGTPYQYESGGLPQAIPSLTQEEFIAFHQKYYHPSNSLTILYGNLNLEQAFDMLEEYFANYEKQAEPIRLDFKPEELADKTVTETYSITAGDNPTDKDYLALAWHVTEPDDALDSYGFQVLEEILFGNNQSPLKKALLEADIGGDINGEYADIGFPGAFLIEAKYSNHNKLERFKQVVQETLEAIIANKLDKELITAAINKITFALKEAAISESNPRGVVYGMGALSTWLYDRSPFISMQFSNYLEQLTELANDGYFEALIERKLLNNPMNVSVILKAEPGKNDAFEAQTQVDLQDYKATLSEAEIDDMVTNTQALIARQESPDKAEDLAKIPSLSRNDLSTEVEDLPLTISAFNDATHFYHANQFTSGIDYVSLYFDIADLAEDDYEALSYLSALLSNMPTVNYDVASLQTEIDLHTGGIHSTISIYEDQNNTIKPYFVLRGKALEEALDALVSLMKEIMSHTQFEDTEEMLKLTQRFVSSFEQTINFSSHVVAANRAMSQRKPIAKLSERVGGIDQFNYLKTKLNRLKSGEAQTLSKTLANLLDKLLNIDRLHVLYIGEEKRVDTVKNLLSDAFQDLESKPLAQPAKYHAGTVQNEAFITAQDVNYVAQAANSHNTLPFNGATQVLATAIRYDYLWNNIRVKGGAYGALYRHLRRGDLMLGSYRDPNIGKTLNTYTKLAEFVRQLDLSESELLKYIIGSISPLEQPLSAFAKGLKAFAMKQNDITRDDLITLKEEILITDNEQLANLAPNIQTVLEDSSVVVIGNKAQIDTEKDLFDVVYELY